MRSRPKLKDGQIHYYNLFNKLSKGRQVGMAGPLPLDLFKSLQAYCDYYGIDDLDERRLLEQHMSALDDAYMDYVRKKQEEESKKSPSK